MVQQFYPLKGTPVAPVGTWDSVAAAQAALDAQGPHLYWWYNYTPIRDLVSPTGCKFVPCFSGIPSVTQPNVDQAVIDAEDGWIMVGNEIGGDAHTVAEWITAWEFIANDAGVIAAGLKMLSPSQSIADAAGPLGTSQFFFDFMAGITRLPDAIAIHKYTNAGANFVGHINDYRRTYPGYRMWMTEFGDGIAVTTDLETYEMMQAFIGTMMAQNRVDRYAYYFLGPEGHPSSLVNTALYNSNGTPRPIAAKYYSFAKGPGNTNG